jgi:hypothetical protein
VSELTSGKQSLEALEADRVQQRQQQQKALKELRIQLEDKLAAAETRAEGAEEQRERGRIRLCQLEDKVTKRDQI